MFANFARFDMFRLPLQMAGHRITALIAVACAVLGGAALITGTGVLVESGLRSQRREAVAVARAPEPST
ncbi:hypothetical protein [Streptomyces sp. SID12501]|uniref:hypothetical protein n=1 Tax=Streptomyces sp. SID12501 TaxID=2706042 RepID=UPI0031BB3A32